jgi:hypothetical protein
MEKILKSNNLKKKKKKREIKKKRIRPSVVGLVSQA